MLAVSLGVTEWMYISKIDKMKSKEQLKKERNDSYSVFWLKISNLDYHGPIIILGGLSFIFAWGTIYLSSEGNKIAAWFTTLLTAICVKFLTDKLVKLRDKEKMKDKGSAAIRNLDTVLSNLVKVKDRGRLEDVDYIEEQIINAIEDWEDVIPDLKYRDRVNQAREINRKIDALKKSNENKNAEIKELEKTLEFEMNKARNFNLNSIPSFSGGTASNY
jgi:hypothetical protein